MSEFDNPGGDIQMEKVNRDDFESTVDKTTGTVSGQAETDFGGERIQTQADVHQQRRGSVEISTTIPEEDTNSIEDLLIRLKNLRSSSSSDGSLERVIEENKEERKTLAENIFYSYVTRLEYEIERLSLGQAATIDVDKGKKVWLMKTNLTDFYRPQGIASQIKGSNPGGTEFVRVGLGLKDFDRKSTPQTQERVEQASSRVDDTLSTPKGRPNVKKTLASLQVTNNDMDGLAVVLPHDPFANHEEINEFDDAREQLKRLSDDYEQLVQRRDEKAKELKYLKYKGDGSVSFVNPNYEGEEGEALLPLTDEDVEKARELEKEIKEFDDAISDQDAKVSKNSNV